MILLFTFKREIIVTWILLLMISKFQDYVYFDWKESFRVNNKHVVFPLTERMRTQIYTSTQWSEVAARGRTTSTFLFFFFFMFLLIWRKSLLFSVFLLRIKFKKLNTTWGLDWYREIPSGPWPPALRSAHQVGNSRRGRRWYLGRGTHGSPVPRGSRAELHRHVISYSACIGPQAHYPRCNGARTTTTTTPPSSSTTINASWSIMLVVVLSVFWSIDLETTVFFERINHSP